MDSSDDLKEENDDDSDMFEDEDNDSCEELDDTAGDASLVSSYDPEVAMHFDCEDIADPTVR